MTLNWLLGWWNLIFVIPFLLALTYLGIYAVSGLTFGDVDVDAGADAGADVDADADADPDADADTDAHSDHHAQGHAGHAGGVHTSVAMAALTWLGLGRVPMSIVLMVLLLTWGAVGFLTNRVVWETTRLTWAMPLASVPAALLVSVLATRGVVRLLGRYLPSSATPAPRHRDLVGSVGEAMYAINDRFGLVWVRGSSGQPYQVPCRVASDAPPVAKGTHVLLIGYDPASSLYTVIPYDLGTTGPTGLARAARDVEGAPAGRETNTTRARERGISS